MKLKLYLILSAAIVTALTLSTLAQNASNPDANGQNHAAIFNANALPLETLSDAAKASSIIGMTVKNEQDHKLGKVAEIAVDVESGRIVELILSSGGFLASTMHLPRCRRKCSGWMQVAKFYA